MKLSKDAILQHKSLHWHTQGHGKYMKSVKGLPLSPPQISHMRNVRRKHWFKTHTRGVEISRSSGYLAEAGRCDDREDQTCSVMGLKEEYAVERWLANGEGT